MGNVPAADGAENPVDPRHECLRDGVVGNDAETLKSEKRRRPAEKGAAGKRLSAPWKSNR